ncbi:VOC family protein [Aeromicrobium choanae]|uniref:VOC domain-containing protein n=1 Tax=Aeromicrobium choanae TaxID=1736691 RepID=A0A1T4Z5N6_9ACTN|nr:hypothetical protein [Aeromicrobium choanae]SKB09377.1 hypothetical protein SAMN06295964_2648 [Aeromicrobium choanae]
MTPPRVIAMLPCADIDEITAFFDALGFAVTYRQVRPNPYVVVDGHGFELHYYGMEGHLPESSHSTCGVIVEDTGQIFEAFAAGLRAKYGKLPVAGFPRITRPRPRKNVGGVTGFSLIDPAGNWIRFFRDRAEPAAPGSPLHESLLNAVVLADSKGDVPQAAKILRGAIARAEDGDDAMAEARDFLGELEERLAGEGDAT